MYDNQVFDGIKELKPSERRELEIADVNSFYINQGTATYEISRGFWTDAGKFETLLKASEFIRKYDKK